MTSRSFAATTEHLVRPSFVADSATKSFVDFGRTTAGRSTAGRAAASCIGLTADIAAITGHRW